MGFLQRLRVSSGATANGKGAAPPLDESLPKPLQGEQAVPPPVAQPPEATAAPQPQRPAVKAAPPGRLRTAAATANGTRPAYAGRPTANGHAGGRGQPRGLGVGRGGARSLTSSSAAQPPTQQQPGTRAGGRGRGRGSPSPARPPPPVRNLSGNRRRPPRSPTVSEKGSMEQIEWERGSTVAISADSRSNSGGALTEEAASPASSRREAPRDPALTPVAQSRHPQTATRLAALTATAAQRPAAAVAPAAAPAASAFAAPAAAAAAVPPPAIAASKLVSHPISAAAAVPPPAPATPDLPSAQPASAQSEISPVSAPPLLPQQPQVPAATAAALPPPAAAAATPAAPPVPPLVLPVARDPAAAVPGAEQAFAQRQKQKQKPAAKQAAANAKAAPPPPKKKSGGLFSCCSSEPATKDDQPAAAADSSTRPRDGSSRGGSRKAAAASEAAAAAAAGRRASGEATAAAAAADPKQRISGGDASSNGRRRLGERGATDSQRAAATLERGRTSPDKSVGGRSAKSGKSASSSSPERVPRPGLPGSEGQKQRRPPPPLRNASADATPRRGRAGSAAGSQAGSVSGRRSSRCEDEARGTSGRRSAAGSQAGSVSGRRSRYDDQVTPEPRRHRRSSSAASVSSVGSVRSTQSRRSVASAASLHVRGYEHVGPYDPEIGAPRPALKRTGSNASLASRSSAGYSSHDGDPAALHSRSPPPPRGRRHRRDSSSGSLASMDSLGSVGSLHSLAEGEPSDSVDVDAWGSGSPVLSRRRRIPSSASLDSFDSASSHGSGVSASSANCDYRAVIKGMDRPMSPLSGGNSLFRGDSLSSGSGSWSITSSELEDVSSTPGSGRRHRSGSSSNLLSPDRARRSSDSLFNGDLGSPMSPAAAQRSASGNSISLASPSDVMSLTSSKARASPGTQVQQMRQLREKVRAMRAETEAHLGAVTQAAAEARARRASGGDDGTPVSPRPDLARLQEQRAKLQRRLEKLGMQQMRLEQHIAEAASTAGSAAPSPPSSWRSGRTAAAVDIRPGRGGGIGGSGIEPMVPRSAAGKAEDDVASVTSNRTASGGRRSGRRVTFGPDKADAPQEDNFLQVVDTVASLKQLLSTHPSAKSPHAQRRRPAATGPVANGTATPPAPGSSSAARAAARAAGKFDYDALGTSLSSGRAGPPPPLKPRDGHGSHRRSRNGGSSSAGGVNHCSAAANGGSANGGSSSRHRAAAAKADKAAKSAWNDDVSVVGD